MTRSRNDSSRSDAGRRGFVRLSVAVSGAVTAMAVATACSGGGSGPSAGSGGAITYGKPLDISAFDPAVAGSASDWEFMAFVYDTLVKTDSSGKVVPSLATKWSQTSPTTYVFSLRNDVKFSNGDSLTADDVVGTLNRIMDPETGSFWSTQLGIKSAKPTGKSQVTVNLEAPRTSFVAALASPMASILDISRLKDGSFNPRTAMLGSGAFKVKSHQKDQSWTLIRNPQYWGKQPSVSTVDIRIMPDTSSRIAGLRNKTLDVTTFDSPDAAKQLDGQRNVKTVVQDGRSRYRLDVNAKTSVFASAKLRQALSLAIDRAQISKIAFGGVGQPSAAIVPGYGVCPSADMPFGKPDVARARALVDQAGAKGKAVQIIASSGYSTFAPIAQVLQQELNAIGFKATIVQPEVGAWINNVFGKAQKFDVSISFSTNYSESSMILSDYYSAAKQAYPFLRSDPTLDALIVKAQTSSVGQSRDALQKAACSRIATDANIIPLVTKPTIVAWRSDKLDASIASVSPFILPLGDLTTLTAK